MVSGDAPFEKKDSLMSERLTNSVGRLGQFALRREVSSLQSRSNKSAGDPQDPAPSSSLQSVGPKCQEGDNASFVGPNFQQGGQQTSLGSGPVSPTCISVDRVVMMLPGAMTFQSSKKDFVEVEHRAELAMEEGTITMQFCPAAIWGRKTLFSKDAADTRTPGHMTAWVHDGRIEARLTSPERTVTIQTDRGTVAVGKPSWLAVTFGPHGFRIYLDGVLAAAKETCRQGLEVNSENLLIGASGWCRKPSQPADVRDFFDGEVADATIYNRQLCARELAKYRSGHSDHATSGIT